MLGRRRFTLRGLAFAGGALATSLLRWSRRPAAAEVTDIDTLRAYLDTLIPADDSPSATAVGIDRQIAANARANPSYRRLVDRGCRWLDAEARKRGARRFAELGEHDREAIVAIAESSPSGWLPQVFYSWTRRHAMARYYSLRPGWAGTGYDGPPQPRGFPDYTEPPAGRR